MLDNTIFIKKYDCDDPKFSVNRAEVWRYCGYFGIKNGIDESLENLLDECILEMKSILSYKVCYRQMDIEWDSDMPIMPFDAKSKGLAKCLLGSSEIVMFAATVGIALDREIAKYQRISPTKALILQGYGAERVECLCDVFCKDMAAANKEKGFCCTPRYSPGYGDLPLEVQKDVFRLLDCNRQIGISLNDSLLMTPSKSVTAIFGIGDCVSKMAEHKCSECNKTDCEFRNN